MIKYLQLIIRIIHYVVVVLMAFNAGAYITNVSASTNIFKRLSLSSYHSLKIIHNDQLIQSMIYLILEVKLFNTLNCTV